MNAVDVQKRDCLYIFSPGFGYEETDALLFLGVVDVLVAIFWELNSSLGTRMSIGRKNPGRVVPH